MKTERRHQLETNELADSLAHWVESARPYFRTVVGLLIAVVALVFLYALVSRHSAAKTQEAWDDYFQASNEYFMGMNPASEEKLDDLADKYPGTSAAWWARTAIGDMKLIEGANLLYRDRTLARERLNSAVEQYETVLKEAKESAVLVRATYGLARAQESLGDVKLARESYATIVTRWPTNALADVAQTRVKDLEKTETQEFYDWFKQQNPGKSLLDVPGKPGEKPDFDLNTLGPDSKSIFPGQPQDGGPALPDEESGTDSGPTPDAGTDSGADTKPEEGAGDKPETGSTPVEGADSGDAAPTDK